VIKEVTEFIEFKARLTRDTDLFAGHRPQGAQDACDVVLESAGGSVFPELPERADTVYQVLSRAKTYMTARARAWAIYDAIYRNHGYGSANWELPTVSSDSISACDATDDWIATAGGVLSIDAGDKKEGTGSIKNTSPTPPIINTNYRTVYNPLGTWDWSAKKHTLFWLKCDRANTAFTVIQLHIVDTLNNWRRWDLTFSAGEWTMFKLLLSIGDADSAVSPDLALIDIFRIELKTADITAFYIKLDDVRVAESSYEIMIIEPLAPPQWIGQDEKGRYEFSCNYIFKIKKL